MRSLLLAPFFLLAACGGTDGDANLQGNGAAAPPPGEPDNRIECRPAGAAAFARACTVDEVETPRGRVFTIRKADGGFRRLLWRNNDFVAADGAQPAHLTNAGDGADGVVEVEIGGDRFRFGLAWEVSPANQAATQ